MSEPEASEERGARREAGRPTKGGLAAGAATTPLMRQYLTIKGQHTDAILFFRMGDFYEMFFEDAEIAARELDITLTARDKNAGEKVPLAGFPHHQLKPYVNKLLEKGYKVAICDQTEDPKESRAKGKAIVERAVTRVLTPGLIVDEDALEARAPSWLAAIARDGNKIGLAFLDISTGELLVTEAANDDEAWSEILRIGPKELLLAHGPGDARKTAEGDPFAAFAAKSIPAPLPVTPRPPREFEPVKAAAVVKEQLGVVTLDGQGLTGMDAGIGAAGAAIAYARENARAALVHVRRAQPYRRTEAVLLDESTRRNLEVFEATTGGRKGSLLDVIDGTVTSMGGRTVRSWLSAPLLSVPSVRARLDAVGALVSNPLARAEIRTELGHIGDLPRIVGRVATGVGTPRDLKALRESLLRLPSLQYVVGGIPGVVTRRPDGTGAAPRGGPTGIAGDGGAEPAGRLTDVHAGLDPCEKLAEDLSATLADDPPVKLSDGGVIRAGADRELDEINGLANDAKGFIAALETRERERTGISSLKVRYNRVFGYYIEITTSHLAKVPKDYLRKQTTAGGERYYTPELKTFEEKVLHAEESRLSIEAKLFEALRARVALEAERLLATAAAIAELDALTGFAERSAIQGWVKPFVDDADVLDIEAGRHPVIEAFALGERFVPNDIRLDDESRLLILTGPNMAGKSTVMRQTALIVLMAQAGCFVPAKRAHVGVVDRVFTRVGASDLLSRGQSTFMVEMSETANILNNATPKSLVIIDEIGRGTSTFDGVSIAWAVAEFLHDVTKAKTLFATHYHELTALSQTKLKAKNFHIAVKEWNDQIIFLRKLVEGATSRSYGIQVARLAGLPDSVLGRAREVLTEMTGTSPAPRLPREAAAGSAGQMSLFGNPAAEAVLAELRALEIDGITPLEALQLLARLKAKV